MIVCGSGLGRLRFRRSDDEHDRHFFKSHESNVPPFGQILRIV